MTTHFEVYSKETDELLHSFTQQDLSKAMSYFNDHLDHYLYVSKPEYQDFRIEGFVLETDDIFRFYNVLIGIYIPKSKMEVVKNEIDSIWNNPDFRYAFTYDANEGVAELNLPLNYLQGFDPTSSIETTIAFVESILKKFASSF